MQEVSNSSPILWRELDPKYVNWGIRALHQDSKENQITLYTLFAYNETMKSISWQYILYRTTDENFFVMITYDYGRKLKRITFIENE